MTDLERLFRRLVDNLIAIDLFSCGTIDGHRVAAELARLLRLDEVHLQRIERGTATRR